MNVLDTDLQFSCYVFWLRIRRVTQIEVLTEESKIEIQIVTTSTFKREHFIDMAGRADTVLSCWVLKINVYRIVLYNDNVFRNMRVLISN